MKVAIIHPNIMCAGGAEVTGLMTIEFFQGGQYDFYGECTRPATEPAYEIDFITDNSVDFNALNEKFSTHIDQAKIRIVRPYLCRLIGKLEPRLHLFAKLQLTLFARYVKKRKDKYDLIISTKQEADFGKPGMQFLHHPPDGYKTRFYDGAYLWVLAKLGRKKEGIMQNLTISPSIYIKRLYDDVYWTNKSYVLHPAIRKCPVEQTEWNKRENGFIIVGHVDKLKETDKAMEVIDELRRDGPKDIHLHIIGTGKGSYYETIKKMAEDREYVELDGFVSTEQYFHLLTTHKYGLHMRKDEPSAVTVRELVDCGEIVFAHNSGGTPEILNYNKHLLFDSMIAQDRHPPVSAYMPLPDPPAVHMIKQVLESEPLQKERLQELKQIKFNTRNDWRKEFKTLLNEFWKKDKLEGST